MSQITYNKNLAKNYNNFHSRKDNLLDLQVQKIYTYLDLNINSKVLDVGCGAGRILLPLSYKVRNTAGVEYSKNMFIQCSNTVRLCDTLINSSYQDFLSTTNLKFDSAYFSYSLHQIEYDTDKQIDILNKTFDILGVSKILLITGTDVLFDNSLLNQCSTKLDEIDRQRFLSLEKIQHNFNVELYEHEMNYKPIEYDTICDMIDNNFISTLQLLTPIEKEELKHNLAFRTDLNGKLNWTDYYGYILISKK